MSNQNKSWWIKLGLCASLFLPTLANAAAVPPPAAQEVISYDLGPPSMVGVALDPTTAHKYMDILAAFLNNPRRQTWDGRGMIQDLANHGTFVKKEGHVSYVPDSIGMPIDQILQRQQYLIAAYCQIFTVQGTLINPLPKNAQPRTIFQKKVQNGTVTGEDFAKEVATNPKFLNDLETAAKNTSVNTLVKIRQPLADRGPIDLLKPKSPVFDVAAQDSRDMEYKEEMEGLLVLISAGKHPSDKVRTAAEKNAPKELSPEGKLRFLIQTSLEVIMKCTLENESLKNMIIQAEKRVAYLNQELASSQQQRERIEQEEREANRLREQHILVLQQAYNRLINLALEKRKLAK